MTATGRELNRRTWFTNLVSPPAFVPHRASRAAARLPNAVFRTQEGREVKLYDDLIRGRQVVINFMYADCHQACPLVTSRLVSVYQTFHDRMGKDLFFCSITVKPRQDDPAALKRYARMRSADRPGWTFLTGDPYDIETVRFRLFRMNHPGIDLDIASHAGTLRIINDATNVWTTAEAFSSIETIVQHIRFADPPKSARERARDNERLQLAIDDEVKRYGYRNRV
jgi:protein SCO1/2